MDWIFGNFVQGRGAAGLLIVRLVFGLGIMLHGWQKINSPGGPMGWMDSHAAAPESSHGGDKPKPKEPEKKPSPSHVPILFQGLATAAEFSGGLGIIFGLLTPVAAFGLICTMTVALCMVHLPSGHPFVSAGHDPSFELAAHYLAVALLLIFTGPGAWSLDALLVSKLFRGRGNSGSEDEK